MENVSLNTFVNIIFFKNITESYPCLINYICQICNYRIINPILWIVLYQIIVSFFVSISTGIFPNTSSNIILIDYNCNYRKYLIVIRYTVRNTILLMI